MTPDSNMIPKGELRCVWMDAGVVDFKLCNVQLCCEECPFDAQIRQQLRHEPPGARNFRPEPTAMPERSLAEEFDCKVADLIAKFELHKLPANRFYTRNHLWFRSGGSQTYTVGIDHLALHLLGPVCGIAFPTIPAKIPASSPCAWIVHELGTIALKAPVNSTIVQVNESLKNSPHLVSNSPYGDGWVFRMRSDGTQSLRLQFLSRDDAAELYRRQAHTLASELRHALAKKHPRIGTTMQDGGMLLSNIEGIVGPNVYFQSIIRALALT